MIMLFDTEIFNEHLRFIMFRFLEMIHADRDKQQLGAIFCIVSKNSVPQHNVPDTGKASINLY